MRHPRHDSRDSMERLSKCARYPPPSGPLSKPASDSLKGCKGISDTARQVLRKAQRLSSFRQRLFRPRNELSHLGFRAKPRPRRPDQFALGVVRP
jgi:hypothetical protein